MNDRYLYKAKRTDNGEWVEGYLFCIWEEAYILWGTTNDIPNMCKVDLSTLCQCTGLTDKNDKLIWENDILQGHGNKDDLMKVVFGKFHVIDVETLEKVEAVIGWHTKAIQTDALSKCEPFCLPVPLTEFYIEISEHEVIGSAIDNPELLEV